MTKVLKKIIVSVGIVLLLTVLAGGIYFCSVNTDIFSPNITVTFDAGDIELLDDEIKIRKGNCVSLPILNKEGYDFLGWFFGETKWEENTPIKSNTTLVAKFAPKKYRITFVVDGQSFYVDADYDSIPSFPGGIPTKQPTETTQFNFVRFSPELEKVSGEATYTAIFEEVVRRFNVKLSSNYQNSCTFDYQNFVDYNDSTTISLTENEGYSFVRWEYTDGSLFSSNKTITIYNVKADIELIAKFELIEYTITYYCPENTINTNPTKYYVTDNSVELVDASLDGFIFKGWYTQSDGQGEKISAINLFVAKNYSSLYAYFTHTVSVNFVVDDLLLQDDVQEVLIGNSANVPTIDTSKYGMSPYKIVGWYKTSDCSESSKFDFTTKISSALTLYGKWQYILDVGFYEYYDEFNDAITTKSVQIDSEEEFIRYIDFVKFKNILSGNSIQLKYGTKSTDYKIQFETKAELDDYINTIKDKSEFPNTVPLGYSYSNSIVTGFCLTSIYMYSDISKTQATLNADPSNSGTSDQYEFAFLQSVAKRSDDFDGFNINKIKQTISVETSNQLVYALEKGLRPVPVAGSSAEQIYNKAKSVLRKICNDSMTDFEKIKAIYDWLILNVQYDNYASEDSNVLNNWYKYDAWYAEGVFNNHKAVCDGIAKSLLILARIENIATIRVNGLHNGSGHAWNKVYIDGYWYGIDATHGNPNVSGVEFLTYSSFLFSDSFKQQCCEFDIKDGTATQTTAQNVYEIISISTGSVSFDLYINSRLELNRMVTYVKSYSSNESYYEGATNHNYFTIEFALSSDIKISEVCTLLGVSTYVAFTANGNISAYGIKISFK